MSIAWRFPGFESSFRKFTFVKINRFDLEDPAGRAGVGVAVHQDLGRQRFVKVGRVQDGRIADLDVLEVGRVTTGPGSNSLKPSFGCNRWHSAY